MTIMSVGKTSIRTSSRASKAALPSPVQPTVHLGLNSIAGDYAGFSIISPDDEVCRRIISKHTGTGMDTVLYSMADMSVSRITHATFPYVNRVTYRYL